MNVNELDEKLVETAKFIDGVSSNWQAVRTIEITRTMLRQQQAEIEALKAKTLTDEEIEGIARANVDGHSSMEQLKWFARAILRKASEK